MKVLNQYEKQMQMKKQIDNHKDDLLGKLTKDFKRRKALNAQIENDVACRKRGFLLSSDMSETAVTRSFCMDANKEAKESKADSSSDSEQQ